MINCVLIRFDPTTADCYQMWAPLEKVEISDAAVSVTVCSAEVTCSSFLSIFLKSQWMSFSMLPFISHKAFHLSIHNRHSSYLPEHRFSTWYSSTCANVLNSSIYLWKQLIVFYRRISPILSFRYSFYVLYILFRSHTHTYTHN